MPTASPQARTRARIAHPWPVRVLHWIGAAAMLCMIFSGMTIHNSDSLLPFNFPAWAMLGGWLAAGVAWHIAAMWALFAAGLLYLAYGFASGHFRRDIGLPRPGEVARDLGSALRGRLGHRIGHYNAVQRALYAGVLVAICGSVATGLSIWKPVQLWWLSALFGGYDLARRIHLACMLAVSAFVVVHVILVAIYPRTLVAMVLPVREASDET